MVFDSANTAGRKVILTEIESRGNNFVVVLSAELKGNKISVNDIRSLYPKDSVQGIIDWINAGNLLKYADKNKALEWIGKQQSNSAEVTNTIKNLDVAAKLLQNFENPAIIEQKNEKNLKEHRLDHQRGYTSNNGKYFSINAEDAMIDGKFPKIEFCKVYGLKKNVFDFLVDLGIIYTDGEWHHMGKTLQKKVFYWWKDRSSQDYRYDLYDNDIDIPEGSYAHIYSQNKDTIDRLIQDAEGKEWKGTEIPILEEYIRRKRPAFIEEEWLTEQDKEERSKLHTSISANTETPARIRYFEHKEVDERYYNIARKKFEEKYKKEDYKKQYLEEYGDKIKQNEKAFGDTESKEHTILNIFKIFAGDKSIEDKKAKINANRKRDRLAKEERIRQEERRIKAEESKKKHQELSKKLDKWLQKQVEAGKAIKRVRIQELPEMFVTTDEEMYGRYGWFKARGTYNLPIYYSGIEFTDKRAYNYYTKTKMELNSLEADFYGVKFFKTKNGEAYGFTVGGKVYIDEKIADASTPIHEYTHLWAEALRKVNPEEWKNIVSLMKKQTHLWDKVKNDYPELKTDDDIADEVLAHYSGERGKKLLEEEYDKIKGNNKLNIFDKAKMLQAINNVREALRKFWKGVADFLGIHFTTAEEVADKVLSDLLEGVNPNEVKSEEEENNAEKSPIRFQKSTERVVEKATDKALEEVKDPILKRAYKSILNESTKDKWASFADDYHALRVMEDKVIEEMRKRDPKFRLHHSVYEQQIAAKAATGDD